MQTEFLFSIDEKEHEALVISNNSAKKPSFVFIHGAGVGSKERIYTFSDYLEQNDVSMLSFDQSGAGKDAANLKHSSLEDRTKESKFVIEEFASEDALTVCGSSMGGEIAVRMLEFFPVKNLILFCPGIYDEAAFTVRFDQGFTDIIRQPESWRQSRAFSLLQSFSGNLLVVIGSEDAVIPPAVIDRIEESAMYARKKEILRIPGCPHAYQTWLTEHPEWSDHVAKKVLEFSV